MQNQMLAYLHILLMILLLKLNSIDMSRIDSSKRPPLWTWECLNEKCAPTKPKSTEKAQSLATCNMLCAPLHLWPQPTGLVYLSASKVPVRADLFQLQIESFPSLEVREHLRDAFDLFREDLHKLEEKAFGFEAWHSVALRVAVSKNGSTDPRMLLKTDESYNLTVQPNSNSLVAEITSNSFCGARHGLETLSQLVWFDPYVGSLFMLDTADIEDAPRFRYRGLLLDTASNYFPISDILRTIDGMAASKLNTFHWHATDSQTFPLLLSSAPQLAQYGAYSSSAVYTPDDVRKIVQRAKLRGIRVLLEVGVTAHMASEWDDSYLESVLHCENQLGNADCPEPTCENLISQHSHILDILENVYREIIQLTGVDDIFHIGGDYVPKRCLERANGTDSSDVWIDFTRGTLKRLVSAHGRLPDLTLLRSSHVSERIKIDLEEFISNLGVQVRSVDWAQEHLSGVRAVISHEDAWDLNSGLAAWHEVTDAAAYNSWQRIYEYRPWPRGVECIEGGGATVWSSTLGAGALDARVWPRAAALAERLWSDQAEAAIRPVQARLDIHRSRLVARGIRASPLWSMWCTHNPYTCD